MTQATPSAVGEILPRAVPILAEYLVEHDLRRQWRRLVGPEIARRARPAALIGDCLHVVVDNSPWLQELTLRAPDLLAMLGPRFAGRVRSLRVTLGAVDSTPRGARSGAAGGAPALGTVARAEIEDAVAVIGDREVADAARRLLTKSRRSTLPRGDLA